MNESETETDLYNTNTNAEISSPSSPVKNVEILSIELGDIILIHAYRNTNVDQQTY